MAGTSKNNVIKKQTPKKKTSKKRIPKKKSLIKKKGVLIFLFVVMLLLLGFLGYIVDIENKSDVLQKQESTQYYSTKALLDDLAQIKVKKSKQSSQYRVKKELLENDLKDVTPNKKKTDRNTSSIHKQKNIIHLAYRGKKPRLVIIIDDVHTKAQLQAIKNLGMKITPSIFPPYKLAKHSNLLAKNMQHYMIHLPMESGSNQFNKQTKTLMTSFSDEQIVDRVMEIRHLFPKGKYINNHTGSVFTSNYKAMKKLYIALKVEGFVFVDSFTTASSKVKKIAHGLGDAYVRRDIFIDNKQNISYIHHQLQLAVAKAKKKGYAIAIGHPHKITLQALASSKQILKDVELVYIDDIYKRK